MRLRTWSVIHMRFRVRSTLTNLLRTNPTTNGLALKTLSTMASPVLSSESGLRIAVEGCGHGVLNEIYASVHESCKRKGWPGVDLLIIGGDFQVCSASTHSRLQLTVQAVRNAHDLKAVSMPPKYYDMRDFHEYYAGTRTAPYLTIFIGGNHEASNYLWELYYGGWVAPRIYYMGAANVIRLGPLRIAGLSGIWKGYNYNKPHFERLPYNGDDLRSIYHVRELDTRKLLQIRSQVDVGLSHDWPRGMEWKGNHQQLFRFKPYFEEEAKAGSLGSVAAAKVLDRLRPAYWFSAHMHARYSAIWDHGEAQSDPVPDPESGPNGNPDKAGDGIDLNMEDVPADSAPKNDAEIDLDLDDDDVELQPSASGAAGREPDEKTQEVSQDIRELLPESFARPTTSVPSTLPFPPEIRNRATKFLALDKCLPNKNFLQLLEISPLSPAEYQRPLGLEYDKEWLAITRVFANDLHVGDPNAQVPVDRGDAYYRPLIEKEMEWVEENIVKAGKMMIPEDFVRTAPVYDPATGLLPEGMPQEYSNPHTQAFCDLLQITNPFHASDEERAVMMQRGPRPDFERSAKGSRGGSRDGSRGRGGRGRGRGGGGPNANYAAAGRARGRGRW